MNPDSLVAAFQNADVVYHLASLLSMDPRLAEAVTATTVVGTRNVVGASLECRVRRLIHFSSIHAYRQWPLDVMLDEARDRDGVSHTAYDQAKTLAEREVQSGIERGLDAVIVNPTGVIGPHDAEPSHLGQFFLDIHRRRLPILVTGGFDSVDVRDVVQATPVAETRGRCGENYILSGGWRTTVELARLCQAVTGVSPPRLVCPIAVARAWAPFQVAWDRMRGRRPRYTADALNILEKSNRRVSSAKARHELGFDPRPAEDSVRDAYLWFQDSGMLAG